MESTKSISFSTPTVPLSQSTHPIPAVGALNRALPKVAVLCSPEPVNVVPYIADEDFKFEKLS